MYLLLLLYGNATECLFVSQYSQQMEEVLISGWEVKLSFIKQLFKKTKNQKTTFTVDQSSIEEIYTKMTFAVMPDFKLQMIMSPWEIRKTNYNLHSLNHI